MNIPSISPFSQGQQSYGKLTTAERFDTAEYRLYSGNNFTSSDMRVLARSPLNGSPVLLGTLSMLSYSVHRDKFPVVSLGMRGTRGFTRGHRTIAGSLAFQSIDTDAFFRLTKAMAETIGRNDSQYILADELPPFDVIVTAINEEGGSSVFGLFGLTILDFGTSFALEQLIPNETYSFIASKVSAPRPAYEYTGNSLVSIGQEEVVINFEGDRAADSLGTFESMVGSGFVSSPLSYNDIKERLKGAVTLPADTKDELDEISPYPSRIEVQRRTLNEKYALAVLAKEQYDKDKVTLENLMSTLPTDSIYYEELSAILVTLNKNIDNTDILINNIHTELQTLGQ